MLNLKSLKPSQKAETGVWVALGGGAEVKVASMSSKRFQEAYASKRRAHNIAIKRNLLTEEEDFAIRVEAMAEGLLFDWRGISADGENELPFSVEAAKKYMTELPDFAGMVAEAATSTQAFKDEVDADAVENLKKG